MDTSNNDTAIINNGIITVRTDVGLYCPIFANEKLKTGQSCEIEVVRSAEKIFMIGVATDDLKNRFD